MMAQRFKKMGLIIGCVLTVMINLNVQATTVDPVESKATIRFLPSESTDSEKEVQDGTMPGQTLLPKTGEEERQLLSLLGLLLFGSGLGLFIWLRRKKAFHY